jgi:DNA-binding response OmpR family regulator
MPYSVLIVDDDVKITKLLKMYFDKENFLTYIAHDGYGALQQTGEKHPDIVILDLMLPRLDGCEVCRRIRREDGDTAVLMLTARDEEADRLEGLEIGADDYVTKPFSPREVVARAKAILRRTQKDRPEGHILRAGPFLIDGDRHVVTCGDRVIDLTPTEFRLLEVMASQPGRTFTRLQLVDLVQGYAFEGYERTMDAHIKNVRRKIEADPKKPAYIQTVYGIGYKFSEDGHD